MLWYMIWNHSNLQEESVAYSNLHHLPSAAEKCTLQPTVLLIVRLHARSSQDEAWHVSAFRSKRNLFLGVWTLKLNHFYSWWRLPTCLVLTLLFFFCSFFFFWTKGHLVHWNKRRTEPEAEATSQGSQNGTLIEEILK
jgi:hypothetical protein